MGAKAALKLTEAELAGAIFELETAIGTYDMIIDDFQTSLKDTKKKKRSAEKRLEKARTLYKELHNMNPPSLNAKNHRKG